MKVCYKPEIAPFNKNPPKAGGFFYGNLGCSALRPCTGRAQITIEKKNPPCRWVLRFQKLRIEKLR
jgi:hypothetical protein